MLTIDEIDDLCVNTIRTLSIDAVQPAQSGHPGMPMGAATMAYVLWTRHLRHNPQNPSWPDRDRFVLSAGHASMLLYSLLFLTGYDVSMTDIQQFRQWNSRTPGHPERGHTPGVEVTTGPLGQGVANDVGLALAEPWTRAHPTKLPVLDRHLLAPASGLARGPYILADSGHGYAGGNSDRDRFGSFAGARGTQAPGCRRNPRPCRVDALLGTVRVAA